MERLTERKIGEAVRKEARGKNNLKNNNKTTLKTIHCEGIRLEKIRNLSRPMSPV